MLLGLCVVFEFGWMCDCIDGGVECVLVLFGVCG